MSLPCFLPPLAQDQIPVASMAHVLDFQPKSKTSMSALLAEVITSCRRLRSLMLRFGLLRDPYESLSEILLAW